MTRLLLLFVAGVVTATLVLVGGLTAVLGTGAATCTVPASLTAASLAPPGTSVDAFAPDQVANARAILSTAMTLGVPIRGWIVAVAVALQESGLHKDNHGDAAGPDSRGIFQQRAAWGPANARLNPATAARLFFLGGAEGQPGLLDISHWETQPLNNVAQRVQHSNTPTAYAPHEADAIELIAGLTGLEAGSPPTSSPIGRTLTARGGASDVAEQSAPTTPAINDGCADAATGPVAAKVVAFARSQLGVPYRWGGNGPQDGGWDCSGLARAAYTAAGVNLPRTAQTQFDAGPALPAGASLRPGDLVFFGSTHAITHVGISIGDGQMIDAPHTGARVRIEDYHWSDYVGATRP